MDTFFIMKVSLCVPPILKHLVTHLIGVAALYLIVY